MHTKVILFINYLYLETDVNVPNDFMVMLVDENLGIESPAENNSDVGGKNCELKSD